MKARDPRFPSDKVLQVWVNEVPHAVRLINVSATGARLSRMGYLARNTLVTISYRAHRFAAQIIWAEGEDAGIRFLLPLSPSELRALRRGGQSTDE